MAADNVFTGISMSYAIDELGIYRPSVPVTHRNDEYDESGFKLLLEMQSRHFWYLGRHRFLLTALKINISEYHQSIIDLGGGVGGWASYLHEALPNRFKEIAMGDSSEVALLEARKVLPKDVVLYQVDLMNLQWKSRWDIIFLLDVMEHCPDDVNILRQIYHALEPGGKLIVSTPALMYFWSHNDEYARHLRRYSISDYQSLAAKTGFNLVDARYFMFLLSPLYWLSRKAKSKKLSGAKLEAAILKEHQVPNGFANYALAKIFSAESPIGHYVRFPWGTSVLGVFEKPGARFSSY
jgi:2-polyprenyl-3-methyl-5-hydroxy-6-metoxy-1,4-benzoquinol methylase